MNTEKKQQKKSELKYRVIGHGVLIKADEIDGVSKGGIVLPFAKKEQKDRGTVRGVGPLVKLDAGDGTLVQVGDKVAYHSYAGSKITINETEYKILQEEEIVMWLGGRKKRETRIKEM